MQDMNATITLREYLQKGKTFVIPDYQRGYVWGKNKDGGASDAVTYMMDSLIKGFKENREVFIQGVTVSESDKEIILIDGQQRTTFFYLLLQYMSCGEKFCIRYDIRKESDVFMANYKPSDNIDDDTNETYQDIYFFKKSLRIIRQYLSRYLKSKEDTETFCDYILDNVKFLYIDIPAEKATTVFSMMNGNKAEMQAEELIKAELLRLASLNTTDLSELRETEAYAVEWDNNMLRSRYAREWDKWLQWWNRETVKKFFKLNNTMGLLISTCQPEGMPQVSFENFRKKFLEEQKPVVAKQAFDKLRRLQKRFEDAFNDPIVYNCVGAIIRISEAENRAAFIRWYFGDSPKPEKDVLKRYYKMAFLSMTHKEILDTLVSENDCKEVFDNKFEERYKELQSNSLYLDNPEAAFRLLLRLNIDEDNVQEDGNGRKFDFSIWDRKDSRGRSLEHIYPKSKVYHIEKSEDNERPIVKNYQEKEIDLPVDNSYIDRDSCRYKDDDGNEIVASEHSIGNLVLLYKDDNSMFNDSSFEEKKAMFFKIPKDKNNKKIKAIFKSRHLLHTIFKFASSEWKGLEIAQNKMNTLNEFKKYYGKE